MTDDEKEWAVMRLVRSNLEWVRGPWDSGKAVFRHTDLRGASLLRYTDLRDGEPYGEWLVEDAAIHLRPLMASGGIFWSCVPCGSGADDPCTHVRVLAADILSRYPEDPEDLDRGWSLTHPYEQR